MKIRTEHLLAIEDHARRGYPDEVCGVLVGQRAADVTVEAAIPVANREREAPRVRYQIAPLDLLRIQRESAVASGHRRSHSSPPPLCLRDRPAHCAECRADAWCTSSCPCTAGSRDAARCSGTPRKVREPAASWDAGRNR